jgi:hypothetical protein
MTTTADWLLRLYMDNYAFTDGPLEILSVTKPTLNYDGGRSLARHNPLESIDNVTPPPGHEVPYVSLNEVGAVEVIDLSVVPSAAPVAPRARRGPSGSPPPPVPVDRSEEVLGLLKAVEDSLPIGQNRILQELGGGRKGIIDAVLDLEARGLVQRTTKGVVLVTEVS